MALRNCVNWAAITRHRGVFSTGTASGYINHGKIVVQQRSNSLATNQEVITSLDPKTGVAVLKLNNPPVNSLTINLMHKFIEAMKSLEQDPKCAALIITSNIPDMFSAGLNLKEFYRPKRENYLRYYQTSGDLWTTLYGTRLATIAALNGSSPAFGCILGLCCDYRIMKTGKGTIGLPEVVIGIPVATWIQELYMNVVGQRRAELDISHGYLHKPEEALRIGLVDELAASDEDLLKQATQHAEFLAKLPNDARHKTKMGLRQPTLDRFNDTRDANDQKVADGIITEKFQALLDVYLEKLKTKK